MKMTLNKIIMALLVIVLAITAHQCTIKNSLIEEGEIIQESLHDSLTTYRNEKGELVSTITTIQAQNTSSLLSLYTKDTIIKDLQNLVSDYKKELKDQGSAGVIHIKGDTEFITKTIVDTVHDSYNSEFNLDDWVWGTIKASKDSTEVSLSMKEEVSFVIGKRKTGFLGLGKPEYFSDVTLKNPYNEVKNFRTYNTKIPKPNWVLSVGAMAIYNTNTGVINMGPGISIGYILGTW